MFPSKEGCYEDYMKLADPLWESGHWKEPSRLCVVITLLLWGGNSGGWLKLKPFSVTVSCIPFLIGGLLQSESVAIVGQG